MGNPVLSCILQSGKGACICILIGINKVIEVAIFFLFFTIIISWVDELFSEKKVGMADDEKIIPVKVKFKTAIKKIYQD